MHHSHHVHHQIIVGSMKRTTVKIPDELEAALEAYRREAEIPPGISAVMQMGLRSFLADRGYLEEKDRVEGRLASEVSSSETRLARSIVIGAPSSFMVLVSSVATGASLTGLTVMVTVASLLWTVPSLAL